MVSPVDECIQIQEDLDGILLVFQVFHVVFWGFCYGGLILIEDVEFLHPIIGLDWWC